MTLRLRIRSAVWEAPNVISYELQSEDGAQLPAFAAGAHVDLMLPNGLVRSYSLLNSQVERHRYVIAVQKDRASRGGSKWVHENLRVGDVLPVSAPRNNFALEESAEKSVFIAGGIGITPILSMIGRLTAIGREWQLFYCTRTRAGAPFRSLLETMPQVRFNFDEEPAGKMLDIEAVVSSVPSGGHLYCCGPTPMLEAFDRATKDLARERVHVEYFTAVEPAAKEGGFMVVLAKSGRELTVPAGKTILDALRDSGLELQFSCTEGICGTCETRVLEGIPDHRDRVLTAEERASNQKIMICCSGSRSERLVLDL